MEHRKEINDCLVQWIRCKVEQEYPEDIALVCTYGSWLSGTMNRLSDVDCYFIPKTERSFAFARTFILEGVGYDIFPMSWERLEEIASLRSPMQPLVGDVQILYCADPADLERFRALQQQMLNNLQDDAYVRRIAEDKCREAAGILTVPSRKAAAHAATVLAYAATVCCREYNRLGMKGQYADLVRLAPWAADHYQRIVESENAAGAMTAARAFLEVTCARLGLGIPEIAPEMPEKQPVRIDTDILRDIYQEICSTFNKIYIFCETGNAIGAFYAAGGLQYELDECMAFGIPAYPLLDDFNHRELPAFAEHTRRIEAQLVRFIENGGTRLKRYASFGEFERDAK